MSRMAGPFRRLVSLPLVVLLAVGCGGDDDDDDDDAVDASTAIDAPCIGHDCPQGAVTFDSDEGGEYRLELIYTPDGLTTLRLISFFMDDMNPDHFPLPVAGECTSYLEAGARDTNWPFAQGSDRVYVDMGDITLTGGPGPFELSPRKPFTDYLEREHDVAYYGELDATSFLTPNTTYDLEISGSDDIAPFVYEDWAYLPPNLTLTDPGFDFVTTIPAGEDFTWNFTMDETPAEDDFIASFLAFLDADTLEITHVCIGDSASGSFTVPASVVDELLPVGNMVRGVFSHRLSELRFGSGRRIDIISTTCYGNVYSVQ